MTQHHDHTSIKVWQYLLIPILIAVFMVLGYFIWLLSVNVISQQVSERVTRQLAAEMNASIEEAQARIDARIAEEQKTAKSKTPANNNAALMQLFDQELGSSEVSANTTVPQTLTPQEKILQQLFQKKDANPTATPSP